MRTVLETCVPRQSILQGTFNPEIFTAALGPVIQHYKGQTGTIDAIYTDAFAFFRDATYPTEGLRQTVSNVFRRIAGDPSVPSIQRMETAFGGGKTHNLIACVHIAYRGKEIADVTGDILDPQYLPEPNSVTVVGIAGDEIPVNKIRGDRLIPYTLWGELAYQVGGEELYRRVKDEAESFAAPGRHFLETVLADRKVLIMLDELAQYAARLEVAVPNQGADQLAAFLMALNGYAKNHAGIAIVVTLAGAADAFSRQTESLTRLLNKIGSGDIKKDDAVVLAERASQGITSVVMRDATAITPVQANEISAVLAKRLFESIDPDAAQAAVEAYTELYSRNSSMLPEEATNIRFRDRILSNYPFHPTLIDFLNNKLAQAENFQGTRGVLRVLALTIRSIWNKKTPVQVVHVSDIDMQSSAIVNELLGRTGSADLRQVLNADIGSVDTHSLQGGLSNAQRLDRRNPHPDGLPFYEMTWKAVFLNSLVGRSEGKSSKVFGASQKDLIFEVSTPLLAPSQVRTALDEISESAFYLRYEDGKYFAHLEPTINSVLAMIRQTIDDRQVSQKLRTVSDSLVQDNYLFRVEHSVKYPQDIPDMVERPTIAVVALDAREINLKEMFTTRGDGVPRIRQNTVLLLVPKSVKAVGAGNEQMGMFDDKKADEEARTRLEGIARQVLAIKALEDNPQAYGIAPTKLRDPEFVERKSERNMALVTTVNEMYAELSDFFYVWEKRIFRSIYPDIFDRRLTNKQDEAVANPVRDGSAANADSVYEKLMGEIFAECRRVMKDDGIMTMMFTHKTQAAWETLTRALIENGWIIASAFPVESEDAEGIHHKEMAASTSSIFLACRKRDLTDRQPAAWRGFGGTGVQQQLRQAVRQSLRNYEVLHLNAVDEMVASYGSALKVLSENWPVMDGDELVSPITAMREASTIVAQYQMTKLTDGRLSVEDIAPEAGVAVTLFGIYGTGYLPFDDALSLSKSLNIRLEHKAAGYRDEGRMIGINDEKTGRTRNDDDTEGYFAPLVKKGSKLRLALPEERNERRLQEPQNEWDIMQGVIMAYREGDIPVARAYLQRQASGHEDKVIAVLRVWADGCDNEALTKEARRILFGLNEGK